MLSASARLFMISGRAVALAGAALTIFSALVWAIERVTAPSWDWNVRLMPVILLAQALLASWLAWSAVTREGPDLFRSAMLAFAVSFVCFYGWYFLLLWDLGPGWMLVGNLAYLASGLIVGVALLLSEAGARRDHGQTRDT